MLEPSIFNQSSIVGVELTTSTVASISPQKSSKLSPLENETEQRSEDFSAIRSETDKDLSTIEAIEQRSQSLTVSSLEELKTPEVSEYREQLIFQQFEKLKRDQESAADLNVFERLLKQRNYNHDWVSVICISLLVLLDYWTIVLAKFTKMLKSNRLESCALINSVSFEHAFKTVQLS